MLGSCLVNLTLLSLMADRTPNQLQMNNHFNHFNHIHEYKLSPIYEAVSCRDQVILQFLAVNDVYSLETSSEGVSLDKPHISTCVFACLFALVSPPDQANHTLYTC